MNLNSLLICVHFHLSYFLTYQTVKFIRNPQHRYDATPTTQNIRHKTHNAHNTHKHITHTTQEKCTTFADYTPKPRFLDKIGDPTFRNWAQNLNDLWPIFGRKTVDDVAVHPERFACCSLMFFVMLIFMFFLIMCRYTLFPQRNPFLVPGGRFRECTYYVSQRYKVIDSNV